ncbi:MAG: hypothetical protein M3Y50_18380 [Acidobacteriota bacterium]|nr:hypothetical protein [Acidobacteriota bacterium]
MNRSKFLYDLHKDFFTTSTCKKTLTALDEPSGNLAVFHLVKTGDPSLLDPLNAFELVAYFEIYPTAEIC